MFENAHSVLSLNYFSFSFHSWAFANHYSVEVMNAAPSKCGNIIPSHLFGKLNRLIFFIFFFVDVSNSSYCRPCRATCVRGRASLGTLGNMTAWAVNVSS